MLDRMPFDPEKNVRIKVTIPRELHEKLTAIAESRGVPLSQLLLQACIDRHKADLDRLDRRQKGDT